MLTRNQIKFISSLSRKTVRQQEQKFVVEGLKLCEELLNSNFELDMLYIVDGFEVQLDPEIPHTFISEKDLSRISQLKTPNKMLAVVHKPQLNLQEFTYWEDLEDQKSLFLDRINDPGNLGTILRLADWFGIGQVFCSKESADVFNAKVIQSSMGSAFRIPVFYVEGVSFMEAYKKQLPLHTIWSAEMEGQPLNETPFDTPGLIVMGSESHGVHPDYAALIDQKVTIPAFGDAESLNVANATSIVLWEINR